MPTAPHPRRVPRLRPLLALASGNWLARGYLAVFAVSFTAMLLFPESAFAGSPLLLTAPLSFLCMFLPLAPGAEVDGAADVTAVAVFAVWLLLCALVNAAVLGALATRAATATSAAAREPLPHVADPAEQKRTDMTDPAGTRPQGVRALLAPAVDNWLARGYLAVVAVALGFFLCAEFVLPDPGFAGIWPLIATAPFSLLAMAVSSPVAYYSSFAWLSPLIFSVGVALSGLVNAVLLGLLARRLRAREPRPAT
ncbi:SCO4225 family membrane protein [Streptomyces sp. NPDC007808]|uniref:SCO4225 family membrane protein n=1 Tax=Streptomyces sp. NPDC007808 TaxID=3364779 RepID=UPI0036802040